MKLPGETTLTLHGRANDDERNTRITKPCSKQHCIEDVDSKHAAGQYASSSLHLISKGRLLASSRESLQRAEQGLRLRVHTSAAECKCKQVTVIDAYRVLGGRAQGGVKNEKFLVSEYLCTGA